MLPPQAQLTLGVLVDLQHNERRLSRDSAPNLYVPSFGYPDMPGRRQDCDHLARWSDWRSVLYG